MNAMMEARLVGYDFSQSRTQAICIEHLVGRHSFSFNCLGDCWVIGVEYRVRAISNQWAYRRLEAPRRVVRGDIFSALVDITVDFE